MSSAQDPPLGDGPGAPEPNSEQAPQPGPRPGPGVDPRAELSAELADLRQELAELTEAVAGDHQRAAHREAVIDRLHQELQQLRRGELQTMYEPVRNTLYRLHDLVKRESERYAGADPPDVGHVAGLLAGIADEVAEALGRTGVERFAVKPGEVFDAARHRPVDTEPVADPEHDGTVTAVRADGFQRGERVVRKAEVCVGRLCDGYARQDLEPDDDHAPAAAASGGGAGNERASERDRKPGAETGTEPE